MADEFDRKKKCIPLSGCSAFVGWQGVVPCVTTVLRASDAAATICYISSLCGRRGEQVTNHALALKMSLGVTHAPSPDKSLANTNHMTAPNYKVSRAIQYSCVFRNAKNDKLHCEICQEEFLLLFQLVHGHKMF